LAAVTAHVDKLLARARARWPGITGGAERFVEAVSDADLETDDLYLACACADGDAAAIAAFDTYCGPALDRVVASVGATPAQRADLVQAVRERLLVAPAGGGAPRIASYSGRGTLISWARVVATRVAKDQLPKARREPAAEDDEIANLIASDDDPEIGYLKRLYRHEFKLAFEAALAELSDRERLVLRQHTLDGLSLDELAKIHDIHRATAARWIERAREALQHATQQQLVDRLQLSGRELASIIRLISSQLDVSLHRLLR
jgi:RNA polymerase sigma-70 factor (ECF subfamily)